MFPVKVDPDQTDGDGDDYAAEKREQEDVVRAQFCFTVDGLTWRKKNVKKKKPLHQTITDNRY